eukprot:COSAG02_NODE_44299_length_367_cov_1.141791_1_plen_55_part_01
MAVQMMVTTVLEAQLVNWALVERSLTAQLQMAARMSHHRLRHATLMLQRMERRSA